mmetsp:Transcript_15186/g.45792  ORF Transcript_15186/g.45792 Transcript_15186/m.45792 type:complete len:227 (-) Transcript_15186:861-1541(-)
MQEGTKESGRCSSEVDARLAAAPQWTPLPRHCHSVRSTANSPAAVAGPLTRASRLRRRRRTTISSSTRRILPSRPGAAAAAAGTGPLLVQPMAGRRQWRRQGRGPVWGSPLHRHSLFHDHRSLDPAAIAALRSTTCGAAAAAAVSWTRWPALCPCPAPCTPAAAASLLQRDPTHRLQPPRPLLRRFRTISPPWRGFALCPRRLPCLTLSKDLLPLPTCLVPLEALE